MPFNLSCNSYFFREPIIPWSLRPLRSVIWVRFFKLNISPKLSELHMVVKCTSSSDWRVGVGTSQDFHRVLVRLCW